MLVGSDRRHRFGDFIGRVVGFMAILAVMPALVAYAQSSDSAASTAAILRRLDTLESQNGELRAQVARLQQQVDAATRPAQIAQTNATGESSQYSARSGGTPVQVAVSTGWSESPYKMPGGFFYGVNLRDLLLTEEDGIPYGFVSGEMMVGAILGNHAVTKANLTSQLGVTGDVSTWLATLELQPTVQYHADFAGMGLPQLSFVDPYLLAGPGIWISMMSTPVVVKGSMAGNGFRHEDADFQPGGVFGFGSALRLGKLFDVPAAQGLLDKSTVGAEWRFNTLANGQGFNQYTGSIAFGF